MAEKLRNKYSEVLKERDLAVSEAKRIRHDYELYVRQNDQVILFLEGRNRYLYQ